MSYRIILKDVYKGYTLDLDKMVTPQETIRRFREKLKTMDLDILEETVRIDNGHLDIPVYFSVCGRDAEAIIGTKKQMGKGGTPQQAEASAVMELARDMGGKEESSIMMYGGKVPAQNAALVNATMARALDFEACGAGASHGSRPQRRHEPGPRRPRPRVRRLRHVSLFRPRTRLPR